MDPIDAVLDLGHINSDAWGDPNGYERLTREVPSELLRFVAANTLFGEVYNGGFDQFFSNSSGIVINDAIAGFGEMDLDQHAAIAQEALALMGDAFVQDRWERCRRMYAAFPDNCATDIFDDLDRRFYAAGEDEACEAFERRALILLTRYGK